MRLYEPRNISLAESAILKSDACLPPSRYRLTPPTTTLGEQDVQFRRTKLTSLFDPITTMGRTSISSVGSLFSIVYSLFWSANYDFVRKRIDLQSSFREASMMLSFSREESIPDNSLCTRHQIRRGRWIAERKHTYMQRGHEEMQLDSVSQCKLSPLTWEPLRHEVGKCQLVNWDLDSLCQITAGRTIAIVGEHAESATVLNAFQSTASDHFRQCHEKGTRVLHIRSDDTPEQSEFWNKRQEESVISFPSIVVLHSGTLVDQVQSATTLSIIEEWWSQCKDQGKPDCHLFWDTLTSEEANMMTECNVGEQNHHERRSLKEYPQHRLVLKKIRRLEISFTILDMHDLVSYYPHKCCGKESNIHVYNLVRTFRQLLLHHLTMIADSSKQPPSRNNLNHAGDTTLTEIQLTARKQSEWEGKRETEMVRLEEQNNEGEGSILPSSNAGPQLSTGHDSLPLCAAQDVKWGSWVHTRHEIPPYMPPPGIYDFSCAPAYSGRDYRNHTYKWETKKQQLGTCRFDDWNAETFCSVAANETILISGDSLSWEHYQSLSSLLGQSEHYRVSAVRGRNHVNQVCDGRVKLVFRRSNHLRVLAEAIDEDFPTAIVLNKGAHYQEDNVFVETLSKTLSDIRNWQRECDDRGLQCQFIWRTSVPGHIQCDDFFEPVNDLAAMEAYVENKSNYKKPQLKYHWHNFREQNELAVTLIESAKLSNYQIMDAYHINILRPDGHNHWRADCLHNCYPGKMDVYSQILQHYLLINKVSK